MTIKEHLNMIEDSACMLIALNREMPDYLRVYEVEIERMALILDSICAVAEADNMTINNRYDGHVSP